VVPDWLIVESKRGVIQYHRILLGGRHFITRTVKDVRQPGMQKIIKKIKSKVIVFQEYCGIFKWHSIIFLGADRTYRAIIYLTTLPESTILVSEPALLSYTGVIIPQMLSLEPLQSLVLTPDLDPREILRERRRRFPQISLKCPHTLYPDIPR
jgi:hypothetical protein